MTLLAKDRNGSEIQALGLGAVQNVAIGASSAQSTAVSSSTKIVRLVATVDCWIVEGANPTASSTTGAYLPAGAPEYIRINPGDKVAVIQASSSGTLNMVECD